MKQALILAAIAAGVMVTSTTSQAAPPAGKPDPRQHICVTTSDPTAPGNGRSQDGICVFLPFG